MIREGKKNFAGGGVEIYDALQTRARFNYTSGNVF